MITGTVAVVIDATDQTRQATGAEEIFLTAEKAGHMRWLARLFDSGS